MSNRTRKTNRHRRTQAKKELSTLSALALSTLVALISGGAFYFACTLGDKV